MKPEDRVLLIALVVVVVVAAGGAAYFLLLSGSLPQTLPVAAGTAFSSNESREWVVHFTVGATGGRLVGGWTAYNGFGLIRLDVANGTVSKDYGSLLRLCQPLSAWTQANWTQANGTVDTVLVPGAYTLYWTAGLCSSANEIVVTRAIRVVPL